MREGTVYARLRRPATQGAAYVVGRRRLPRGGSFDFKWVPAVAATVGLALHQAGDEPYEVHDYLYHVASDGER